MKLKTVKGKVLAGVLAVGVVSSAGIAFANTNAGEALSNWFDGKYNSATESIESQVTDYAKGFLPELAERQEDHKDHVTNSVNVKKSYEIRTGKDDITNAKDSHLESLGSTKAEIMKEMGPKFYNEVFRPGKAEIDAAASQGLEYATNDLTRYSEGAGQDAVDEVTQTLNEAKDDAVSELEAAIEDAKAEITAKLDEEEAGAVHGLKGQVDIAVNDLKQNVNDLVKELVKEQHAIVADAAKELRNNAKAALDDVVSGIDG
ncbi:hypothetical protein JNUCC1_00856 [Lentibacillus sp. JNUCC-1]|uniref:hypothetical protein n=1 Tax=Lentibacillus sp. JNUCC-1 TaxID=2654513 RepID=UPI0012E80632|nr:hypothetical protein [Lentibacillus sp. JNUCC-1]MUV37050.1 hypothetical protein [Lentibacillus sp. JNUCC-1]